MKSVCRRALAPLLPIALAAAASAPPASALSSTTTVFFTQPQMTCAVSTGGLTSASVPTVDVKWESRIPSDVSPGDPIVLTDGAVTVSDQTSGLADALRSFGTSFDATLTSLQIATTNASGPIQAASPIAPVPVAVPVASTNPSKPASMGFAMPPSDGTGVPYAPTTSVTATGPAGQWVTLSLATAIVTIRSYATADRTGPSIAHLLTCKTNPGGPPGYPLTIAPGPPAANGPVVTKITGGAIQYVGGPIMITGKRFTSVKSVQVGGVKAKYVVINSTTIAAIAPAVGWFTLKDVTVTTSKGTSPIVPADTVAYVL